MSGLFSATLSVARTFAQRARAFTGHAAWVFGLSSPAFLAEPKRPSAIGYRKIPANLGLSSLVAPDGNGGMDS